MTNITDDYDIFTSRNYTEYYNMILSNCTDNEHFIDKIITTLFFTKPFVLPCGLMSLMVYTIFKPLIRNKWKLIWYLYYSFVYEFDQIPIDSVII